jgi:hypothetical protein
MKNPWLSIWLSAANSGAGAVRGFRTAEMRRQQKAMMSEAGCSVSKHRAATKKRAASKRGKKSATKRLTGARAGGRSPQSSQPPPRQQ